MKLKIIANSKFNTDQRGAALVTVIMISVLLLTASIALLSAVGANSRNSTDILSETKAYYAAESGLQATINVLRNDDTVDYEYADANPTLSAKLPYNWPIGSPTRAVVGQTPDTYQASAGIAYSIFVTDPDNSSDSTTFSTSGVFLATGTNTIAIPSSTATPRTVITFTNASGTIDYTGSNYADPLISTVTVNQEGGGVAIGTIQFRIDYRITSPRTAVRSMYGKMTQASAADQILVTFASQQYSLVGSDIELCSSSNTTVDGLVACEDVKFELDQANPTGQLYANITPVEPFRLKVLSTGYGPGGAQKRLEAIIQRNLFNGLASGAATSLIGENCVPGSAPLNHCYEAGNSNNVNYDGGNCETTGCVPTFGLTNPDYLQYVLDNPPADDPTQYDDGLPQLLDPNALPDWQSSPAALDELVDNLRAAAQNSGRYFLTPSTSINNPGDFAKGTGITFCEGSCSVGGAGGGILVVTGKLTSLGGFDFRGMIIVTGEEGWQRNGGGNGSITGNVVIAPYNQIPYVPENLSATFLPPRYWINGGGVSDIIYADVSASFDELDSISDFMLGIAEK